MHVVLGVGCDTGVAVGLDGAAVKRESVRTSYSLIHLSSCNAHTYQ